MNHWLNRLRFLNDTLEDFRVVAAVVVGAVVNLLLRVVTDELLPELLSPLCLDAVSCFVLPLANTSDRGGNPVVLSVNRLLGVAVRGGFVLNVIPELEAFFGALNRIGQYTFTFIISNSVRG